MTDSRTALARHIASLIAKTGPISLSHYMALALGHAEHGYYMTRDPLGTRGDFITAPEVSQMFGELIGLWLADSWIAQGAPKSFVLAELGPGRGTLMSDALRAMRAVPGIVEAAEVHFVETSPVLRKAQRERIPLARWHERIDSLPDQPLFLIANEFFDALPIVQYQQTERGWCERRIGLLEGKLSPVLAPVPLADDRGLPPAMRDAPIGAIAEIAPASTAIAETISARISARGGAALIVDYGHRRSAPGDTLQALRGHRYVDPFDMPGEADLTAHVDFEMLARAVRAGGADAHGPVEQGAFLAVLGIEARAAHLREKATDRQARDIDAALRRLTAPGEMGSLFKVLAVMPLGMAVPAGFV